MDVALGEGKLDLVEDPDGRLSRFPFSWATQKVLFGHHLKNRPNVLSHASVNQHQTVLQPLSSIKRNVRFTKHLMRRQQTSAADSILRVSLGRQCTGDEFDARPDSTRILPAST